MKKVLSALFAIYFLATSIGFGITTHYCFGRAIKTQVQLAKETLSCGMMMQEVSPTCSADSEILKKQCCSNHFDHFELEDSFEKTSNNITISSLFLYPFVSCFLIPQTKLVDQEADFNDYSPPLLSQDLSILYQVFRI